MRPSEARRQRSTRWKLDQYGLPNIISRQRVSEHLLSLKFSFFVQLSKSQMMRIDIPSYALALLLISPTILAGGQQEAEIEAPTENQTLDEQEVEALIDDLVSKNSDPNPGFEPFIGFADEYDHEADIPVHQARKKLIEQGKIAFPILIRHVDDPEYCLAFSTSILRGFSVGRVCFMIIEDQVDIVGMSYKSREGEDGEHHGCPNYFTQFCDGAWYSQKGLEKWWSEKKDLSLKEMQIEALEWRIEQERNIGFPGLKDKHYYLAPLLEQLEELKRN